MPLYAGNRVASVASVVKLYLLAVQVMTSFPPVTVELATSAHGAHAASRFGVVSGTIAKTTSPRHWPGEKSNDCSST